MEKGNGSKMKGAAFVDAMRLMFDKAIIGNTIYMTFSKNSSRYLVFIVDRSIKINNALVELLRNIPIRVKNARVPMSIIEIILPPGIVRKNIVKNVKNVSYDHTVNCLLDVKYEGVNIC